MTEKNAKQYVIDNTQLMAEWTWENNNELRLEPEALTLSIHKRAWWKCSKGHEWQATIASRNREIGCPYCAREKHKASK